MNLSIIKSPTFAQSSQSPSSESDSSHNTLPSTVILGGATAVGTSTGYYLYRKDKLEINAKVQAAVDELKRATPAGYLKATEQLNINFYDLAVRHKTHKNTVFPNCIMLVGENQILNKHLIQNLGWKSNCHFVEINNAEDILEHLENAEKNYKATSKRTLLRIEKFDELINPEICSAHQIAGMKNLMSCSSDEYHTTIIFSTKYPSKLDSIATQSHRIGAKIDVDVKTDDYTKYLQASLKESKTSAKYWRKPEKSKIWIGALIGFAVGLVGIGIKYLNSNKEQETNCPNVR